MRCAHGVKDAYYLVYLFFAATTMNRDYGEELGSDEERSIESEDLVKDDVSDLFDERLMRRSTVRRSRATGEPRKSLNQHG